MLNRTKLIALAVVACPVPASPQSTVSAASDATHRFNVAETSIAQLQQTMASGRTSSHALVEGYLARIKAYDQAGPRLNAVIALNPLALSEADALDRERRLKGARGPLHGIPILIKDNFNTADMPTSDGTIALATLRPAADATQVARLRGAGAIILGKTTMHEFAAGMTTISSLTGYTRNPYDPSRSPGGSSGGTGAAVAASFAAAGMGSDTCGSVRIPAAYNNLFGLRVTSGLSSRAGIIPFSTTQDVAGPIARSVEDLAVMLDATVGPDALDGSTADAARHKPDTYRRFLGPDRLRGARLGVVRIMFGSSAEEAEGARLVGTALSQMRAAGASIEDVDIPELASLLKDSSTVPYEFRDNLDSYLHAAPGALVGSLNEIVGRGLINEQLDQRLRDAAISASGSTREAAFAKRDALRRSVRQILDAHKLDALIYPTSLKRPPLIEGDDPGLVPNCQLSATTGLPALAVPVGLTERGLPVGLELLGDAFTEGKLLGLASSWENVARPRRAPFSTPRLVKGHAPRPVSFGVQVGNPSEGTSAEVHLRYDPLTGRLDMNTVMHARREDAVIALTLHRAHNGGSGPVVASIMTGASPNGEMSLMLTRRDRRDLSTGGLYLELYTRRHPLGAGRATIQLARVNDA